MSWREDLHLNFRGWERISPETLQPKTAKDQEYDGAKRMEEFALGHSKLGYFQTVTNELAANSNPCKILPRWNVRDQMGIRRVLPAL